MGGPERLGLEGAADQSPGQIGAERTQNVRAVMVLPVGVAGLPAGGGWPTLLCFRRIRTEARMGGGRMKNRLRVLRAEVSVFRTVTTQHYPLL